MSHGIYLVPEYLVTERKFTFSLIKIKYNKNIYKGFNTNISTSWQILGHYFVTDNLRNPLSIPPAFVELTSRYLKEFPL